MDDQNNLNNQNPLNPMDQTQSDQNIQTKNQEPLNPVIETPSVSNEQTETDSPVQKETPQNMPSFTQVDSATPPPPPIPTVEEFSNKNKKENQGSGAPDLDIPSVIVPNEKPKKKFGGKTIATILGILVLLGGIGTGILLLKQSQDIREKAAVHCIDPCSKDSDCAATEYCYIPAPPACPVCKSKGQYCSPGSKRCSATWLQTCNTQGTSWTGIDCGTTGCDSSSLSCNPTPTPSNFCKTEFGGTCRVTCISNEISNPHGGCLSNETCCVPQQLPTCPNTDCNIPSSTSGALYCKLSTGGNPTYCCPIDKPLYDVSSGACTTSQNHTDRCIPNHENKECDYSTGEMCTYYMGDMGYSESECLTSTPGEKGPCDSGHLCMRGGGAGYCVTGYSNCQYQDPTCVDDPTCKTTPNVSAQCLYVKVYDENWNTIPTAELADLAAGDIIKFAVKGTAISGSLDKARFIINTGLSGEITNKKPGTEEFYVEYVIPEGLSKLTVKAELHHTTLGWF
ncbi:hypothetical protein KJ570_03195 [Patescibacteria group bacterium]|nr:hypothetical protein [Patescibacteria group bacterium]MBU2036569.1 hypothetical protein [Patescibacteria group bacterium]